MTDLQELITRGRMILAGAEKRLQAFELVNGGRSTKEIAKKMGRDLRSLDRDLGMIRDMELIQEKKDTNGKAIRKDGHTVYEKSPLIKHVPISYFGPVANTSKLVKTKPKGHTAISRTTSIHIPSENEILDICNEGEGQLYEFKAPGVSADKITKEISGFLHTKR